MAEQGHGAIDEQSLGEQIRRELPHLSQDQVVESHQRRQLTVVTP